MKWTVVYLPSAQDELIHLWTDSHDRQAVVDAADTIDEVLGGDAVNAGESRDDGTRVFVELPLAVLFEVHPDDNLVSVFAVFRWRSMHSGS